MEKLQNRIAVTLIVLFILTCMGLSLYSPSVRELFFSEGSTAETLGLETARAKGCFQCHGLFGEGGIPNPGNEDVPSWQGFTFMMSMENEQELREWILDGAPERLRGTPAYERAQEFLTLRMPAYRGRLTQTELDQLVSLYHAVSGTKRPDNERAKAGLRIAGEKGCFTCHGPGGRFDIENPGSFTGRIPAWNGPNFEHLVKNDEELRSWILDGGVERLERNPFIRRFMQRQVLQMPAYREHLSEDELEAIIAYIHWLRDPEAAGHEPRFTY